MKKIYSRIELCAINECRTNEYSIIKLYKNIPYGQSSANLPLTRSLGHSVAQLLSHLVTWSLGRSVTQSLGHSVTWSLGHSITWSLGNLVTRSLVTQSLGHKSLFLYFQHCDWLTNGRTNNIRIYRSASQTKRY